MAEKAAAKAINLLSTSIVLFAPSTNRPERVLAASRFLQKRSAKTMAAGRFGPATAGARDPSQACMGTGKSPLLKP
jgi:hypothetical protein